MRCAHNFVIVLNNKFNYKCKEENYSVLLDRNTLNVYFLISHE